MWEMIKEVFKFFSELFVWVESEMKEVNDSLDELNKDLAKAADERRIERQKNGTGEKHE